MIDFNVAVTIRYGAKGKIGADGQTFCVSCFSYTILLLLKTENIEVGSKKKHLASIES